MTWKTLMVIGALPMLILFASHPALTADNSMQADEDKEIEQALKEAPPTKVKPGAKPQMLDFEADVIEGVRKAPQLFLQMEIETPNLDTVIYNRKNFNDFHVVEKDRRPLYQPVGKGK